MPFLAFRLPALAALAVLRLCLCRQLDVRDFGAVPDNATDCSEAFRACFAAAQPGDTVLVPAAATGELAVYLTGPFNLSSHVTLHVAEGTVVRGKPNATAYPHVDAMPSYGGSRDGNAGGKDPTEGGLWMRHHPLVWGVNCEGARVTGGGVFDGSGAYWWDLRERDGLAAGRPHLMEFRNCTNVEVSGVTLTNSAFWTLHILYTTGAWVHDATVLSPENAINADGIDPDSSSNVLIERCHISVEDDHVAIKSGINGPGLAVARPSRNITIRDCVLGRGRGISIGSEVSGGVEDVLVTGLTMDEGNSARPASPSFQSPSSTLQESWGAYNHWGFLIKTAPPRGAFVRRVTYENSVLRSINGRVLEIGTWYDEGDAPASGPTDIRDIAYRNITVDAAKDFGAVACFADHFCQNVTLEDITIKSGLGNWTCENVTGSATRVSPPLDACFDSPTVPSLSV